MKKLLCLIGLCFCLSCSTPTDIKMYERDLQPGARISTTHFTYNSHKYLVFIIWNEAGSLITRSVVHDPDCPCMVDYE